MPGGGWREEVMKTGCERMESWAEIGTQKGSGGESGMDVCPGRSAGSASRKDLLGVGRRNLGSRREPLDDGTKPTVTADVFLGLCSLQALSQTQRCSAL